MLTADLVRARKRQGQLSVTILKGASRKRALELAESYVELAQAMEGERWAQVQEGFAAVPAGARERKLADGLKKLTLDRCEFEADCPIEPRRLRLQVFELAAKQRRRAGRDFVADRVLQQVGNEYEMEAAALGDALFSDLKSEHRLRSYRKESADGLVERYNLAQYQAVLLRASQVQVWLECQDVAATRALFRALKFRRLLFTMEREGDGYHLRIDGPFSLFDSVTKYGLQLALLFPALLRCKNVRLEADVRWGKTREALTFAYEHRLPKQLSAQPERLVDELEVLVASFDKLKSGWTVSRNDRILALPGIGVCVPDLTFQKAGTQIHFELLGFWSRDAVWKRVELVQAGLPEKMIFAVSTRLRVSESVLEDVESSALYVFKGTLRAKAVLTRLEELGAGS